MMNASNEEEDHRQQAAGELSVQHQQVALTARRREHRLEVIRALQHRTEVILDTERDEIPFRYENKTDKLVETFLVNLKDANFNNEEVRRHQQAAADADEDDDDDNDNNINGGRRGRILEVITILQQTEEAPFRYENKIDEIVETVTKKLNIFADARRSRRLELIPVLGPDSQVPVRTKDTINELVDEFLHHHINANIENEEDRQYDHDDSDDGLRRRRLNVITILQQTEEFSSQYENRIDQFVENSLERLKDDIHHMICDSRQGEEYYGLDSNRDTEAEVVNVLRFFPSVLTRKKEIKVQIYHQLRPEDVPDWREVRFHVYPMQLLTVSYNEGRPYYHRQCNTKAVSFLPPVASLAKELGLFDEQERGGLLSSGGFHILHNLMRSDFVNGETIDRREYVDDKYLQVLIQLRKMDLLKKEDIQMYNLLNGCLDKPTMTIAPNPEEKRYRFLVEWDPSALTHTNEFGYSPIHTNVASRSSFRGFQSIFEDGIHYFPKKKGINLLFRKNNKGETPFQKACEKYKPKQVKDVVEDTLIRYITSFDNHASPLNIVDALMMAAIEENVHLDAVYTLIRRQPDILQKMLSDVDADADATSEVI